MQTAIEKAQAEKDVKEQAWILRRAFDAILEECKKADPENDESTKEVVEILKSTIKKGAPLFNDGKHKDCSNLYFQTARATVATFLELELVSQLVDHPTLGVLRLDYDYPAAPGDIDSPDSYDYPVIYRVVPGLTFQMAQSGDLTPEVMEEMKEALRWLTVEAKVTAITGDCGFMMWFQGMARGYTDRPVFLSSLMQLPTISASLCPKHDKILVVTANVQSLRPMQSLINDMVGTKEEDKHFVFVGLENVPHFGEEVEQGLKVDVQKAEPGVLEAIKTAIQQENENDPDRTIRAILLECTELPPYAAAIRATTRLPVYDSITTCNFVMKSFLESERFGREAWYKPWDGTQQDYQFAQNLTAEQKKKLVFQPVDEHAMHMIHEELEKTNLLAELEHMGLKISMEDAIQAIADKIELNQAKETFKRVEDNMHKMEKNKQKSTHLVRVKNFFGKFKW